MKKLAVTTGFVLFYLVALYLLSNAAGMLWWGSGLVPSGFAEKNYDMVSFIGFVLTLLVYWVVFLVRKKNFAKAFNFASGKPESLPAVFLAGIMMGVLTTSVCNTQLIRSTLPIFGQFLEAQFAGIGSFAAFLPIIAVMYAMEEMVFRGVIFNEFKESCGPWWALILSSAVYGLLNIFMIHPAVGAYAAVSALFYALANIYTGTLVSSIILQVASIYVISITYTAGLWKALGALGDGVLFTIVIASLLVIAWMFRILFVQYRRVHRKPLKGQLKKSA